jgi:transposase
MQHRNAPLTPLGRRRLVALVEEHTSRSRSTAHDWVLRWRRAGEEERADLTCLEDRSSAPHHRPSLTGEAVHDRICEERRRTGWGPRLIASETGIPHATVSRCLRRRGLSRRPAVPKEAVRRFEWPCPGDLLQMDTKRFARFPARPRRHRGPLDQRCPDARAGRIRDRPLDADLLAREGISHRLEHYNRTRRHSSIGDRPPVTRVRDVLRQDS